MPAMGRFNTLEVLRTSSIGLFLDGGTLGDVLLPTRQIPRGASTEPGDSLRVFLYLDSEDRPIATTERPKIQVGEFAALEVVERTPVGIFLDWGLPKDLLLPHFEERTNRPLRQGDRCVVVAYLDDRTRRITASMRLDRYLDQVPADYARDEAVELLITGPTDLGFNAIINHRHRGLLHKSEAIRPLRMGTRTRGYIRRLRDDGRIDLSLQPRREVLAEPLAEQILEQLQEAGGMLPISDKSDPVLIQRTFGVSKGNFKKTIGGLYKQGLITIDTDGIRLVQSS
ncbi:S1-like domain-containing RNA-binding protein [Kushneria sp. AK178]